MIRIQPGYSDGTWAVVRVNDDGRAEVIHAGLRAEAASLIAGALRDEQSDEDVGAGWNVVALGRADLNTRLRASRTRAESLEAGGEVGPRHGDRGGFTKSTVANGRRDPAM